MELMKNLEIIDLSVYIKKEKALVIGDLHIGYEEALNKQGVFVPRLQFEATVKRLEKLLSKTKAKIIIINGDLKHEFGSISETEWRQTLKIFDILQRDRRKIVIIKGNHDKILGPIANKRDMDVREHYVIGDYYICHGDSIPLDFENCKTIIIGHEHPAVGLREGAKTEVFKCFLKGKFQKKNLVVIPSFNLVTEGTDILTEKVLSPFLKQDLNKFEVFIVSDKVYYFGKVKDLNKS